jgi:hypothetical protein
MHGNLLHLRYAVVICTAFLVAGLIGWLFLFMRATTQAPAA